MSEIPPSLNSNMNLSATSSSTRTVPKDFGNFRNLVVGWEHVGNASSRSRSPVREVQVYTATATTPTGNIHDLNSINMLEPISSYHNNATTPTSIAFNNFNNAKSSSLKEQFFLDTSQSPSSPSPSPSSGVPIQTSRTPTTPTYLGSGYRFAGVERLTQRQKIYDPNNTNSPANVMPTGVSHLITNDHRKDSSSKENLTLTGKRELFVRDNLSSTNSSTDSTLNSVTGNSGTPTKELYLSRYRERERERDRMMSVTARTGSGDENKPVLTKDADAFVGFSALPNQIHRRTVKKGFEFTLMVVGESGLGKSTLVNSMFLTDIYSDEYPGPSKRATKTVQVETTKLLLKEKSVNLHLTIVDTPGFGGAVDNTDCWKPIVDYIENRYEDYLNAETRVHRTHIPDNRVHCCLYFIYPSGHSLKPLDIEFMLNLHDKVNIIPVIAKADTLTPEECHQFKKNVMNEITQHKIKIYEFPECDDEEEGKLQKQLKSRIPFAVVGSNYVLENNTDRKRGRKYPWGIVEIENMEHCDFVPLRNMLIRHYMLDLLDTTNNVHYENYRCRKLTGIGPGENKNKLAKNNDNNKCPLGNKTNTSMVFWNPLAQMEEEKKDHDAKMEKMKSEMEQVFEMKVKEKVNKLKESEDELQRRDEAMREQLEAQKKELEEKRQYFLKEQAAFELITKDMEEMRRANTLEANSKDCLDGKNKEKKKKSLF